MSRFPSTQQADRVSSHLSAVHAAPIASELDFNGVFDRFAPYVAAVALRLLGDEACVDDLLQEVFLDCFRKFDTLNDLEHARRWLIKVTVRKAGRLLRKRKLTSFFHSSLADLPDPPMPSVTADERAAMIQLFCILERLPVNCRLAWSLRFLEGADLMEVADACGCSLATAKRRIRAAHRMISGGDDD